MYTISSWLALLAGLIVEGCNLLLKNSLAFYQCKKKWRARGARQGGQTYRQTTTAKTLDQQFYHLFINEGIKERAENYQHGINVTGESYILLNLHWSKNEGYLHNEIDTLFTSESSYSVLTKAFS